MRKAFIGPFGDLNLGVEAEAAGYRPGTVVDVVILSTGSLLIQLSDTPALDLPPARALGAPPRPRHIGQGRAT